MCCVRCRVALRSASLVAAQHRVDGLVEFAGRVVAGVRLAPGHVAVGPHEHGTVRAYPVLGGPRGVGDDVGRQGNAEGGPGGARGVAPALAGTERDEIPVEQVDRGPAAPAVVSPPVATSASGWPII